MLYELFSWLKQHFNIMGAGVFQYLTFRAAMAILLSLIITTVYGKRIIIFLKGMGLKDVMYLCGNMGLKVNAKGVGKVIDQSIIPGETISKGQILTVALN